MFGDGERKSDSNRKVEDSMHLSICTYTWHLRQKRSELPIGKHSKREPDLESISCCKLEPRDGAVMRHSSLRLLSCHKVSLLVKVAISGHSTVVDSQISHNGRKELE